MLLFKGKKYITIEKYPYWTKHNDRFIKTLINLGFTKVNLRIKPTGYSDYILEKARNIFYCVSPLLRGNINIKDSDEFEEHTKLVLKDLNGFKTLYGYNQKGKLCGAIEDYTYLYKYDCIVDNEYSNVYYSTKMNSFIGMSHRAACMFKIGDKLFEENWIPTTESQIPKKALHTAKKVKNDSRSLYEISVEYISFKERGSKTITNLEECREAARNFALHVS